MGVVGGDEKEDEIVRVLFGDLGVAEEFVLVLRFIRKINKGKYFLKM